MLGDARDIPWSFGTNRRVLLHLPNMVSTTLAMLSQAKLRSHARYQLPWSIIVADSAAEIDAQQYKDVITFDEPKLATQRDQRAKFESFIANDEPLLKRL